MLFRKPDKHVDTLLTFLVATAFQIGVISSHLYGMVTEATEGDTGGGQTFGFGILVAIFWLFSGSFFILGLVKFILSKDIQNAPQIKARKASAILLLFLIIVNTIELISFV